jgi:hypothetical protein
LAVAGFGKAFVRYPSLEEQFARETVAVKSLNLLTAELADESRRDRREIPILRCLRLLQHFATTAEVFSVQ